MENLNNKPNLAKAIISVMASIKGIEKSMNVGTGSNSYKGVSDQEVKFIVGGAMAKYGLCLIPIGVEAKTRVDRWTETGGQYGDKQKQSVFTEATTRYLLLHESGESVEICGYGHGIDAQDKGAGKATTYALKYALLYTFLIPTGKIDDSDRFHSDEYETPGGVAAAFDDIPDASEKKLLDNLVYNSTLDEAGRIAALESIARCMDYKTYEKIQHRLETLQKGFDEVSNPNAADINRKVKSIAHA